LPRALRQHFGFLFGLGQGHGRPARANMAPRPSATEPLCRAGADVMMAPEAARSSRGDAMKFHWFHLMPYPELPEDFKESHRSVWVDVPSSLFDPKVGHRAYNEYLDELEYAESVGFDGICVNEHH